MKIHFKAKEFKKKKKIIRKIFFLMVIRDVDRIQLRKFFFPWI